MRPDSYRMKLVGAAFLFVTLISACLPKHSEGSEATPWPVDVTMEMTPDGASRYNNEMDPESKCDYATNMKTGGVTVKCYVPFDPKYVREHISDFKLIEIGTGNPAWANYMQELVKGHVGTSCTIKEKLTGGLVVEIPFDDTDDNMEGPK